MKIKKCIIKDCKRTNVTSRGLCQSCYVIALKLVTSGKSNWQDLTEKGLALKRESTSPFMIAFESK